MRDTNKYKRYMIFLFEETHTKNLHLSSYIYYVGMNMWKCKETYSKMLRFDVINTE